MANKIDGIGGCGMGTIVVGVIVAALVACAARSIYKDRKAGKCSGCSGCSGSCPSCQERKIKND